MPTVTTPPQRTASVLSPVVIVAALGYFVDIYDLLLFSIVRKPSLTDLGLVGDEQMNTAIYLLDLQMIGLLLGGILWGVLGDKRGRLSVLFASIFTYSLANILNGFVTDIYSYAALRFIAGIGLAGELGIGITLVSEVLPKESRGYGTTLVASIGIVGAVFAGLVADTFHWRTCYFIGGGLGLALLALRIGVTESGMFAHIKQDHTVKRGDVMALFTRGHIFKRYINFILIGMPIWFVVGLLITLSPEFSEALGMAEPAEAGKAVMFCYAGLALGDLVSGTISQVMRSRKRVLYLFLSLNVVAVALYFLLTGLDLPGFYAICALLGFSSGYWVIFMTIAAEQFGTNLRATITTTIPNFVRGGVVPMTALFNGLQGAGLNTLMAGAGTGVLVLALAIWASTQIAETYGRDMDFVEEY